MGCGTSRNAVAPLGDPPEKPQKQIEKSASKENAKPKDELVTNQERPAELSATEEKDDKMDRGETSCDDVRSRSPLLCRLNFIIILTISDHKEEDKPTESASNGHDSNERKEGEKSPETKAEDDAEKKNENNEDAEKVPALRPMSLSPLNGVRARAPSLKRGGEFYNCTL
jgi:hypothetical protein